MEDYYWDEDEQRDRYDDQDYCYDEFGGVWGDDPDGINSAYEGDCDAMWNVD